MCKYLFCEHGALRAFKESITLRHLEFHHSLLLHERKLIWEWRFEVELTSSSLLPLTHHGLSMQSKWEFAMDMTTPHAYCRS